MNFFCSSAEFDEYVTEMELDPNDVIKADIDRALIEAKETFEVSKFIFQGGKRHEGSLFI